MIEVACHCGDVRLTLPHAPAEVLQCNCSMCRKSGFRGVYYSDGAVGVTGPVESYVRTDIESPCMAMWRCRRCGILTHWTLLDEWPYADVERPERMGVNANLLDPAIIEGLPVRHNDGASM